MTCLPPGFAAEDRGHGRGRGLYCARDIAAGAEFFSARPFAAVAVEGWLRNVCAHCMTFSERRRLPVACAGCQLVWYCSPACEVAARDAGDHLAECGYLRRLARELRTLCPDYNFPPFRTRLRFITHMFARIAVLRERDAPAPDTPPDVREAARRVRPEPGLVELMSLVTNRALYERDEGLMEMFRETHRIVSRVFPPHVLGTVDEYLDVLCREECNSFGFWDSGDEMYGYGLYPAASFFNHDCAPNTCKTTRGREVVFRALRRIPAGEEIVISYVLPNDSVIMRRKAVRETYLFDCMCARCLLMDGQSDAFLRTCVHACGGFWCPDDDSPGAVQRCSKCGVVREPASAS